MGLLTDFFVASRADAQGILDGTKTKGAKNVQLKHVDTVKLASLRTLLGKQLGKKVQKEETEMLTDEEAEQWVFLVAPSLVELLIEAGDAAGDVAGAWAKTAELKADGFTVKDAREVVLALQGLAAQAKKQKKDVLLRMSL